MAVLLQSVGNQPSERARVVKDGSNVAVTVRRFGPQQRREG